MEESGSSSTIMNSHQSEADEYIKEHKLVELFENLTEALVYHKPDDPKSFAKDFIQQLKKVKSDPDETDPPCFMKESNLESLYGMLDVTERGYISYEQYLRAMENLGLKKFNQDPLGGNISKINKRTFVREAEMALKNASATFS